MRLKPTLIVWDITSSFKSQVLIKAAAAYEGEGMEKVTAGTAAKVFWFSLFTSLADFAFCISPFALSQSYLVVQQFAFFSAVSWKRCGNFPAEIQEVKNILWGPDVFQGSWKWGCPEVWGQSVARFCSPVVLLTWHLLTWGEVARIDCGNGAGAISDSPLKSPVWWWPAV